MKETNFKTLFMVEVDEGIDELEESEKLAEVFEFQGSKNWTLYFSKPKSKKIDFEKLFNVTICEFGLEEEEEFKVRIQKNDVLDFSIEHKSEGKFFVLIEEGGRQPIMSNKISHATRGSELDVYGLAVSLSFLPDKVKRAFFDEIKQRREVLELTQEPMVEFDFEDSEYYYGKQSISYSQQRSSEF